MALLTVDALFGANVAYFDAADSATITQTGGAVSAWASKGTVVNATQATGTAQPTYSATGLNGGPALVFNGSKSLNLPISFLPSGNSDVVIFGVFQGSSATSNQVLLKWGSTGGTGNNLFGYRNGGNKGWFTNRRLDAQGATDLVASAAIFIAGGRYSDATPIVTTYDNGTLASSATTALPAIATTGNAYIGANDLGLGAFSGSVGTVGVINRKITDDERQKLEGILAWRFGTQASLPANHPYKAAAPTVDTGGGTIVVRRRPLLLLAS